MEMKSEMKAWKGSKMYKAKSVENLVIGWGGGGEKGIKNQSCSECPETHFDFGNRMKF